LFDCAWSTKQPLSLVAIRHFITAYPSSPLKGQQVQLMAFDLMAFHTDPFNDSSDMGPVLCERSCITYVKLSTNKNRQIMVGNSQTSSPLVPSAPAGTAAATAGTSSVRFLGFFKGYTDIPNVSDKVHHDLPQLARCTQQVACCGLQDIQAFSRVAATCPASTC
jgi:hypothetical protein